MDAGPRIRAVVFDAYGTLFDVHSVAAACEALFPGQGARLSQSWRVRQLEYSWLRSLMQRHADFGAVTADALHHACDALGLPLDAVGSARLMDAYLSLAAYTDAAPALRSLAPLPCAILSNGSPRMLEAVVRHAGLSDLLRAVISVEEAGMFKPSPAVYRLVEQHLRVPPGEVAFVSSNGWDISGAASFGFRVFWCNRMRQAPERLPAFPDVDYPGLDAVAAAIRAAA